MFVVQIAAAKSLWATIHGIWRSTATVRIFRYNCARDCVSESNNALQRSKIK